MMTDPIPAGPGLTCPGCGSPDVDLRRGLFCGECAETIGEEAPPAPAACLCSHLKGSHQADLFTGARSGPCILKACGCGNYRPDPRGAARQQERRTA